MRVVWLAHIKINRQHIEPRGRNPIFCAGSSDVPLVRRLRLRFRPGSISLFLNKIHVLVRWGRWQHVHFRRYFGSYLGVPFFYLFFDKLFPEIVQILVYLLFLLDILQGQPLLFLLFRVLNLLHLLLEGSSVFRFGLLSSIELFFCDLLKVVGRLHVNSLKLGWPGPRNHLVTRRCLFVSLDGITFLFFQFLHPLCHTLHVLFISGGSILSVLPHLPNNTLILFFLSFYPSSLNLFNLAGLRAVSIWRRLLWIMEVLL